MPDLTTLLAFVAAALVVLLIPGPGVLYVVARSASQGYRAGLVSACGLSAGAFLHVVAATLGLSAILLTSATTFAIVKALGAAYLIYLGLKVLLTRAPAPGAPLPGAPLPVARLFSDGVIVSLFNPKIALFFLAFLPQFVDPSLGPVTQQVLLLGGLYCLLALVTDSAYALMAGSLGRRLHGRLLRGPLPRYLTGGLFIGLGVNAALSEPQP